MDQRDKTKKDKLSNLSYKRYGERIFIIIKRETTENNEMNKQEMYASPFGEVGEGLRYIPMC